MHAMTVIPGKPDSAEVSDRPEPGVEEGSILVEGRFVGICGTDAEIVGSSWAQTPPGEERLVLGHESLGRVADAPAGSPVSPGDLVMGIVRRPDPAPCPACARGLWDFCQNGRYTERGIKGRHGFGAQHWRADASYLIRIPDQLGDLGVLVEPTAVVAKAWDEAERVGSRSWFRPRTALVTGAGPIGLLAALLARQRGLQVDVLDQVTEGVKPDLVRSLGARYATDLNELQGEFDVVIETTGVGSLILDATSRIGQSGVVVLLGIAPDQPDVSVSFGKLASDLVRRNGAVIGSVNEGRRHHADAVDALAAADRSWLEGLITRRVPLSSWPDALHKGRDDVKVVVDLQH